MLASRLAAGLCFALGIALVAGPAAALEKCKASIDKKDGSLFVDAGNVDGTLTWGYGPFTATEDFGNGTECLSKGKAKKCTLAPVGNELRTMPPSSCWLYLGDDSDSCEVWVQGCVPGTRPICPLDMQAMGGWCIDIKANALASGDEPGAARLWCHKWAARCARPT